MKKIYLAHAVLLIFLGCIGEYTVTLHKGIMQEFYQNIGQVDLDSIGREKPTLYYGIFSLVCFAYTMFVGIKTKDYWRKTGLFFFIGGLIFFLWALAMVMSPTHISIDEVFIAWLAYIAVLLPLTVWVFKQIDHAPKLKSFGEEIILDDFD